MWIKAFFCCVFFTSTFFSQSLDKITKLDKKLNEISGLEVLNDSCLLAINDSGNKPVLFVLNLKGKIIHEVKISNATNVDWEDLTIDDKGNIYIADIGNNLNLRKNLCIYKVKADSLLFKTELKAEKISFEYEDQNAFPPDSTNLNFDAEAIACFENELYIFSKCRSIPYSGKSNVYKLSCEAGNQKAHKIHSLQLKNRKMRLDGVTAAEFDGGICYVLTYSGIEVFSFYAGKFVKEKRIKFKILSQKEALCKKGNYLYLADEKVKSVLDPKLYRLKIK